MSTSKPRNLPVYDDFGNLPGFTPAERTFERKTGCWNCKSFEADTLFRKRVTECFQRDISVFVRQGLPTALALSKAGATKNALLGLIPGESKRGAVRRGIFGICLRGKADGDFVACKHLCYDGWDGLQGLKGARAPGEKLDEPVAALFDDLGEKPGGERK